MAPRPIAETSPGLCVSAPRMRGRTLHQPFSVHPPQVAERLPPAQLPDDAPDEAPLIARPTVGPRGDDAAPGPDEAGPGARRRPPPPPAPGGGRGPPAPRGGA